MRQKIASLVLVLAFAVTPSAAFAQTDQNPAVSPEAQAQTLGTQDTAKSTAVTANSTTNQLGGNPTTSKADFQAKLAAIKDEKRKALVVKIDTKISSINTARTKQMTQVLNKLSSIVERLSAQEQALSTQGKDTASLKNALSLATNSIATASQSVTAQSTRVYAIEITTETGLKQAVSTTILQFKQDFLATHQKVLDARKKVEDAVKILISLKGTTSASVTPTTTQ